MKDFPSQGILDKGIPVQTVPQRRAPLFVTPPASKVADTFGAVAEEKLAKAMGVSAPKIGGPTLVENIISRLRQKPATMDDLIAVAGKGRKADSVKQTVHRLARQGHITSTSPHGVSIYSAEPNARIMTQAQIAKERRMETWRGILRATQLFTGPATARHIAEAHGKCVDYVREQLRSLQVEGFAQVHTSSFNVSRRYTVTPAGLAFMKGKAE